MIKIGDRLPDGTLQEFVEVESEACGLGPNVVRIADALRGKKIALFAVPGAFTPTCSAQHVPGFVEQASQIKGKGVDEIWCVSVNDVFVMGAWAQNQKTQGRVRMLADGSGVWTRALGLELDLVEDGLGIRSQRYSMLVDNGMVTQLNVETGDEFKVSDAATLLKQLA